MKHENESIPVSGWFRVLGGASFLIAMSALVMLMVQNGQAADGGFQPGKQGFSNPYAPPAGGSQFFVALSPQPHLDGAYTVLGRVVAGLEVVDTLRQGDTIVRLVEAGAAGGGPRPGRPRGLR